MTGAVHQYRSTCTWSGSTAAGYEAYDRAHEATSASLDERLQLSSDAAFRGDPRRMNPELLLLIAASSCQLLSFLSVCAQARVDVVDYQDDAEATMPEDDLPVRVEAVRLRPRITARRPATEARLLALVELAHRECYIANSLRSRISVLPEVTIVT